MKHLSSGVMLALALAARPVLAQDGGPGGNGFSAGLIGFRGDTTCGFTDSAVLPYFYI